MAKSPKKEKTKTNRSPYATMLNENRMKPAGQFSVERDVCIPEGVTLEDIMKYEYWKQCSKQLGVRDKLRVFADNNSFYAEFLVIANEPGVGSQVHPLIIADIKRAAEGIELPKEADNYLVENKGFLGWCVIRKSDDTILSKNNDSELDARRELVGILKAKTAA